MKRTQVLFFVFVVGLFLASCQPKEVEIKPPDINYGQDTCDRCGMIIGESQFAAALQFGDGKTLIFDDAGEMFAFQAGTPDLEILAWWVHDYLDETWIAGETAFYVKSETLTTPMGTGIACFSKETDAEAFAAERNGKVYTFEELHSSLTESSMGGQ